MSRIWKQPVIIPDWVTVEIVWNLIKVTWSKWTLEYEHRPEVKVEMQDKVITISIDSDDKFVSGLFWLTRTLISNMVIWVSKWFTKTLQILWVWFSAKVQWTNLVLALWFSHPVTIAIPNWITVEMDKKEKNMLHISWADKQEVWEFSAHIRKQKKPEPYKWKWIRYKDEYVKKKAWKSVK